MSAFDNAKEGALIPELARGIADYYESEEGAEIEWKSEKHKRRMIEALRAISREAKLQ